jgi:predicted transcriptional regulator
MQSLSDEHGNKLVKELCDKQGVKRARVSPRTRRLLLVEYDPAVASSQLILGTVLQHGYDARLVGM